MISQESPRKVRWAKKSEKKKIFVGMSGGVDSSVSAALLVREGHDVTGVFIKVWQPDWIECTWREERRDAMRAAAHLGIPFVTLDLEKEYKEGVIDYMIAEYACGRTPNPDVMCNREVKFGAFWRWAEGQGADAVATGHYAQTLARPDGSIALAAGADQSKDQSYFLWTLGQKDLPHILFPVGHLQKTDVRALAKKFGLPNAAKKDSQGLCFIGKVDIKEFLRHYVRAQPGSVLNERGETIGTHPGALLFTIGERHGFTVTQKTPNDAPYYVVAKDVAANSLIVSNEKIAAASRGSALELRLARVNWCREALVPGKNILVRARYRQALIPAKVASAKGGASSEVSEATISISTPIEGCAPGQSLVAYSADGSGECVGGGIIV